MTSAIRVAIIGAGIISDDHAKAMEQIEGLELVAVVDVVEKRARDLATRYACEAFTDLEDMLRRTRPDAAIVAVPHSLHAEVTIACLRAGCHVLVEKPMATSVDDCTRMIESASEQERVLMVGHIHQYAPIYVAASEILSSGELGQIVGITDVRNIHYFPDSRPAWFLDPALAGGGITINLGAHSIDRIQLLAGSKVASVHGAIGRREPGMRVEGDAHAFLTLENGVTASMICVGYHVPALSRTEVYCTNGTLRCGYDGLHVARGTAPLEPVEVVPWSPFVRELEDFLAAIRGERGVAIPGEYGRAVIETILSLYEQGAPGEGPGR